MSKHGTGPSRLRISQGEKPWVHCVELDGHDISRSLTGLSLAIEAGCSPAVTLQVQAYEAPVEVDGVRAVVSDETRALLVRLGWTPPGDEHGHGPS